MRDFFKSIKFKLILCLIALLIGIMLYSLAQSGSSAAGSKTVNTIAAPFRYISATISENLSTGASHILSSKKYYNENIELRDEISRLRNELVDYDNTKAELAELKKFIGIKEEHEDYVLSPPCRVLAYSANDPFGSFIIDKGSDDGISIADPVVTADGLVGAVTEISEKYCTVRTILSPELSIGVKAMRKGGSGILEGDAEFASDGMSRIIYLDKNSSISVGDMIITTGSSGLFPADYIVGTVTELGKAQSGLSYYAVVKPFADIKNLTSVMVVTSFEGKGEADGF